MTIAAAVFSALHAWLPAVPIATVETFADAIAVATDVADAASTKAMADATIAAFGGIDIAAGSTGNRRSAPNSSAETTSRIGTAVSNRRAKTGIMPSSSPEPESSHCHKA